jgi:hypothetical protein
MKSPSYGSEQAIRRLDHLVQTYPIAMRWPISICDAPGFGRGPLIGALAVSGAWVLAWLLTGVGLGDAALFLGHEAAFVLIPGAVLYLGLRSSPPSALELLGGGYALGSVLEVLVFALTAGVHARPALWAYPVLTVAGGLALLQFSRRRADRSSSQLDVILTTGVEKVALAGVCVLAIAYIAVAYFLFEPLPSRVGSVVYIPDLVFHLGVATDALHHWPIMDPKVAGLALPYETFVYMKLAAVSQITHISLPTVLFRLYILPMVTCAIALFAVAGKRVSGRFSVGILAAGLFLFVGQLGLDPHHQLVFANTVFFSIYDSPSYIYGLVLFLAALVVLLGQLERRVWRDIRSWTLLAVLLLGCAGAKAAILPVIVGGLPLYMAWRRLAGWRAQDRVAVVAFVLTTVIFVATYLILYQGESGGLRLHPPGTLRAMAFTTTMEGWLAGSIGHPIFWVLVSGIGLLGFCGATLAGIPFTLTSVTVRRSTSFALLVSLFAVSLVPFFVLAHKGNSQSFFTYYGLCGACLLSAQGLTLAWERVHPMARGRAALLSAAAGAWLLVLLAAAILPNEVRNPPSLRHLYVLWIGLPAAAVGLLVLGVRLKRAWRPWLQLLAVTSILVAGALDTPLHIGDFVVMALHSRNTLYAHDSPRAEGLTPGEKSALAWVKKHAPTGAVLAVNNQSSSRDALSPDYYYYSAFSEHRVFLEGWLDTIPASAEKNPLSNPFPLRLRLNSAVFARGDRSALATMERRFGVRYLLADRVHGAVSANLGKLGQVVFKNPQAVLYRVG